MIQVITVSPLRLRCPQYQFCICRATDDAAHYLQPPSVERRLNARFRSRERAGEHFADHHIGHEHLLEQRLQPSQPIDTGQAD
jgi:hypothetical protein